MTIFQNETDKSYFEATYIVNKHNSELVRGSGLDFEHIESQMPCLSESEILSKELLIEGCVVFTMVSRLVKHKGVVEYLKAARLSISDVFVLPTYYREGVPRVLLEAGSLGLPLITTDMPGCRDVVRDGIEGFLVSSRSSQALADAMIQMASSEGKRAEMGSNARARVEENFSLDGVVGDYSKIYHRLLNS